VFQGLQNKFVNFLQLWVALVCRKAIITIITATIITLALLYYSITQLEISTDTSNMLSSDLPFREDSLAISTAFPQFSDNIVAVIDGVDPNLVDQAADQLINQLRQKPELYSNIFDPQDMEFFKKNGLLYLDENELTLLSDRLIAMQPLLGPLWKNPTLPGLFKILSLLFKESKGNKELIRAASPVLEYILAVINAQAEKKPNHLSWRRIMSGEPLQNQDKAFRHIIVQPKLNYSSLQPGENAIEGLRKIYKQIELPNKINLRLRLTGSIPLAEEELESVVDGMGIAGAMSLVLVLTLLFWGLKSPRLVLATLITLVYGLIWTAGFATLAVGTLNLISVAFAVLFIGLSVDFGIHFSLRYLEGDEETFMALQHASYKVGGALFLSAIAAAIGFFSFLPTDYIGLAELGLIAGGGMFIALFSNLTLLPAFIVLLPPKKLIYNLTTTQFQLKLNHKLIIAVTTIFTMISIYLAPKVVFDFDPVNLKNPKSESVSTFLDLMITDTGSPYSITVLAKNLKTADLIAAKALKLPVVDSVRTLSSLIPTEQANKLEIIENLALILGPALNGSANVISSTSQEREQTARNLQNTILESEVSPTNSLYSNLAQDFTKSLKNLFKKSNFEFNLQLLEQRLLSGLPKQLDLLKQSLNAEKITYKNLPGDLVSRQIALDYRAKIEIIPKGNMRNREQLAAFVEAVRIIAPKASGTPVIIIKAADTIIRAFIEAAILSFICITILIMIFTRSLRELILIFIPLLLAALFTLALAVTLNLSFNFANVIVLPLLFGLGIAGSIHIVHRDRDILDDTQIITDTSTARAVFFSALTTMGSFGSIAMSSHPGTSSMGSLLTIAISLSLLCTLVILPALLSIWPRAKEK
jgi:hopanoid biosynthesis associated RND transporter like protein HpnN